MRILLLAAVTGIAQATTFPPSTVVGCATHYGTVSRSSIATLTEFYTKTTTLTKRVKTIPTTTLTPVTYTSNVTQTQLVSTVVETQTTDTYTTSQTSTSIITYSTTDMETSTVFSTTTITLSSTTTISAPAAFTPLEEESDFNTRKPNSIVEMRNARDARRSNFHRFPAAEPRDTRVKVVAKSSYPKSVVCKQTVEVFPITTVTYTATKTSTETPQPVTTTLSPTVTSTTTSTSVLADATSFVTVSTIITTSTTSTSTTTTVSTSTVEVDLPSATTYAQCASNNIVSSYNGLNIGYVSYNSAFKLRSKYDADATGYSCCVTCATTKNCAGFGLGPHGCYYIVTGGRCDGSQTFGDSFHYYLTSGTGYVVGNGQCGSLSAVSG